MRTNYQTINDKNALFLRSLKDSEHFVLGNWHRDVLSRQLHDPHPVA